MSGEPMKFRKKPVVVEAWRCRDVIDAFKRDWWNGLPEPIRRDCDERGYWTVTTRHYEGGEGIYIPTLEGSMFASPDDWIIMGVKGEFYPCKPDVFDATYERAGEAQDG